MTDNLVELAIGLRKAADDYDDTVKMIVRVAREQSVDANAIVGYEIDPQLAQSEHSPLIRKAADALTTMQDREATLIRVLRDVRPLIEGECVKSFDGVWERTLSDIDEAVGTSGLVERTADDSRRPSAPNSPA